jgi:hypothetical protein
MVTAMGTLNCKKMGEGTIFCRLLKSRAPQRHHDEQKCIPAACGYKHQDNVSSYVQEWLIELTSLFWGFLPFSLYGYKAKGRGPSLCFAS